jgi:hypothetical protein
MNILALCFANYYWKNQTNIDLKLGTDVLKCETTIGQNYDLILAAPPCDQFTKANAQSWERYPATFVAIANKCLDLSLNSGKPFVLENPPGRIERFIPGLSRFRMITYQDTGSNKEYILYSNHLLIIPYVKRYGKSVCPRNKAIREKWTTGLIDLITLTFNLQKL